MACLQVIEANKKLVQSKFNIIWYQITSFRGTFITQKISINPKTDTKLR